MSPATVREKNWTRGLLWAWIVASLVWLVGWLIYVWKTCSPGLEGDTCYTSLWSAFQDRQTLPESIWDYATIVMSGIIVPVAALILGAAVLWAVGGFRAR